MQHVNAFLFHQSAPSLLYHIAYEPPYASGIANLQIDDVYDRAINAGATGGKLLGAGGAGFMLFYVPEDKQESIRKALDDLREMEFEMDNSGATIVMTDRDFI